MYHYVENVLDVGDTTRLKLDTNPAVLANQLEELKKAGYQSYFVEDIPDFIDGKRTLVDKGIVLTFDDGYEDFYTNAFPVLKKYGFKSTLYVISNFVGRKGFLNQTELKDIASSGIVEIGDHTLTHPDLRHISRAKATKEIVQSKADLEKLLNIKIHTFAYPGGGLNSDVVDIVKTASFDAAVSTKPGVYLSDDNMFTLPRIRPGFLTLNSITLFFNKFKI
jgi:peptidoglycan/xylan/chitin deacetylase (PgdA/CDA1 family)